MRRRDQPEAEREEAVAVAPAAGGVRRFGLLALGHASVGAAALGVVLPLLPTTPFLLLAVWAYGRASPALAERLRRDRRFGPALRRWQERGEVSRGAKRRAFVALAAGAALTGAMVENAFALGAALACMAGAAAFIATRPSSSSDPDPREGAE
ncbi:hypothetical protein GCM10009416_24420 [Craurococcus roseus]|uniref:DUF454 domain-containing protein n=1 Tax=Craurococcus roseus TaxID=77585 RepID=A0ABN1F8M0_9PROT